MRHASFVFPCALVLAASAVQAVDYPVSGTVSFSGNEAALPAGSVFGPSAYDPATGTIAPGAFRFPDGTASVPPTRGR